MNIISTTTGVKCHNYNNMDMKDTSFVESRRAEHVEASVGRSAEVSACQTKALPTFSSAKLIVKKLSIVHCQLSIVTALSIAFCLLFAGSLSAQDNYSVIVKCPVIGSQTGYMSTYQSMSSSSWSTKTSRGAGSSKSSSGSARASNTGYAWATGTMQAFSRSTYTTSRSSYTTQLIAVVYNSYGTYNSYTSASTQSKALGFANFNISAVPSFVAKANGATMTLKDATSLKHQFSIYGLKTIPTANNSANWAYLTNATSNGMYNYFTTNGNASYSLGMWNTATYTYNSSNTLSSVSSSYSTYTYYYKFYHDLISARTNNVTSMGMMFSEYGYGTSTSYSFNVPSSNISLNVQYEAPWSKVLSPSAKVPATSACATGGTYTLTASQSMNTSYVSVSPQTWTWYSATASGGPYASIGTTTASAYTVSGRNDPGTVWYRYAEKASMVSNTARSTVTNYYTIGTNLCSPAKIEFKCTPLPSNPTFSATATGDRSVTLTWSGISGTDHYLIRYGVDGGISFKEITVPYGTNTVTIENLTNGREYYFQIQAIGGIEASGCQYCTTQLSTKAHVTPDCDE